MYKLLFCRHKLTLRAAKYGARLISFVNRVIHFEQKVMFLKGGHEKGFEIRSYNDEKGPEMVKLLFKRRSNIEFRAFVSRPKMPKISPAISNLLFKYFDAHLGLLRKSPKFYPRPFPWGLRRNL